MKKGLNKPIPMLLGADLNAYSVAMAFHEAYGVRSYAMGRYKCGLTQFSKIVKMQFCSGYESIDTLLPELFSFAKKYTDSPLILIPCADCYVEFINEHEEALSKVFNFQVPGKEIREKLCDKAEFYKILEKFSLPYPEFIEASENEEFYKSLSELVYPIVLKPSRSAEYWRHPFPGMRKVYYPKNEREVYEKIREMRYYGYKDKILIQDFIRDAETYVYTLFISKNGKGDFGVFGKVVLEECGKTSEGNHSAIITEEENSLTKKLREMLKELGYYGFANFDILKKDGRYYVLELNARQGRSCDHIRCAGINIAKKLMASLDLDESVGEKSNKDKVMYKKIFWHYPSFSTAVKYMNDENDKRIALSIKKNGESFSALNYLPDIILNPLRFIYISIHHKRMDKTFENDFSERIQNEKRG